MRWVDFLTDDELNGVNNYWKPSGPILFGKIVHDIRQCLGGFRQIAQLSTQIDTTLLVNDQEWLATSVVTIDTWLVNITTIFEHWHEYPEEHPEWPTAFQQLQVSIALTPQVLSHAKKLVATSTQTELLIQLMIGNLQAAVSIHQDLEVQEYRRLWTTLRY